MQDLGPLRLQLVKEPANVCQITRHKETQARDARLPGRQHVPHRGRMPGQALHGLVLPVAGGLFRGRQPALALVRTQGHRRPAPAEHRIASKAQRTDRALARADLQRGQFEGFAGFEIDQIGMPQRLAQLRFDPCRAVVGDIVAILRRQRGAERAPRARRARGARGRQALMP
ncbi:hypothetical protein C2U35_19760, partial [Ralstonia solanacearum]